jgi:hypothetical protein
MRCIPGVDGGKGDPSGLTGSCTNGRGACRDRPARRIHVARPAGDGDRRPEKRGDRSAGEYPWHADARPRGSAGGARCACATRRPNAASDGSVGSAERSAAKCATDLATAVRTPAQRPAELTTVEPAAGRSAAQRATRRSSDGVRRADECATQLAAAVERSPFEPAAVEPTPVRATAQRAPERAAWRVAAPGTGGAEPPEAIAATADPAYPNACCPDGDQGHT